MSKAQAHPVRRLLVLLVATLLTATSAAVPALDAGERNHGPTVESEHDEGCYRHNHTACIQAGANLLAAGLTPSHLLVGATLTVPLASESGRHLPRLSTSTHRSRAPPLG